MIYYNIYEYHVIIETITCQKRKAVRKIRHCKPSSYFPQSPNIIEVQIEIIRNFQNAEITGSIFVSYVDSLDWKEQGVEAEINQVLNHKHLGNGSILLFHNDAKYTPQALDTILKGLKEKGYDIVPVSEIIHTGEYTVDHEGRQIPSES